MVTVNATVIAITATFGSAFKLTPGWAAIDLTLLVASLVLSLVMLYAWTHGPTTQRLAGLIVSRLAASLFAFGVGILVIMSLKYLFNL